MTKPHEQHAVSDSRAQKDWRDVFLAMLADTSNVSASARAARVSKSRAYRLRREDEEFARKWQVALCEGYDNLEIELLFRMRTGELKPAAGARRGVRQFDNAVALRLLSAHRESTARVRAMRASVKASAPPASVSALWRPWRRMRLA